ncbi:MAG: putative Ig domain-containing protein [Bacteroidales bacterium]|nr:putative Ig domain-containing protein [Bacteroidales bacterium]
MKQKHPRWTLIVLTFFITSISLYSQNRTYKWRKTYNGSRYAALFYLADIKFDNNGNKFVLGSEIQSPDDYNMVLIGCNAAGDTILNCAYKDPNLPQSRDFGNTLHFDSHGNIIVVGTSQGDLQYRSTIILKYDTSGTLLWKYRYYNTEGFEHNVMQSYIDDTDNLHLLIRNKSIKPYLLISVSPEGQGSSPTYINMADDSYFKLKFDIQNNFILRYTSSEIQKYNLKGEKIWEDKHLYEKNIRVSDCFTDSNGNHILIGIKNIPNTNNYLYKIVKYAAASGELMWEAERTSTARDVSFRHFLTTSNGDVVGVYQEKMDNYDGRIHFIRFNSSGDFINEFDLTNSWGRWKEIEELILTKKDQFFYAAWNCEENFSYDYGEQRIEAGLVNLDGTTVWSKELVPPTDTTYASVNVQESFDGNLDLFLRQEIYREGEVFSPKDKEWLHKRFDLSGNQTFQQTHRGESFSELQPHKMIKGDNYFFVFAETDVAGARKEFVVLKYDIDGNLLNENHHTDDHMINYEIKSVNSTLEGGIKVIYRHSVTNESGDYEKKFRALTFNSEGTAISSKDLEISTYDQGIVSFSDGSYGIHYYATDKMLFKYFSSEDISTWEKNLSDASFLKDAEIVDVDKNDAIYFYSAQTLTKVDKEGNKLWDCSIPADDIRVQGAKIWADGKTLFWFDEEVYYHYAKVGVCKISTEGVLEWYTGTTTLQYALDAVPLKEGGAAVLGHLSDDIYTYFDEIPSLLKFDTNGRELEQRVDFTQYMSQLSLNAGYCIKQANAGEEFFLSVGNTIMKFDGMGNYQGHVKHNTANAKISTFDVGDILLFEDDLIISTKLQGKSLNYTTWSVIDNYCYSSQGMDNNNNRAPEFVVDSTAISDLAINPVAIDPDGDHIIYSSVGEDAKHFDIYPLTGHTRNISVDRGMHPVVIRAIDPHGAYSDLKYTYKKGPDTAPFICSEPNTSCRGGSRYTYEICVNDEESDIITFSITNQVPDWLSIDSSSGILTGTPPVSEIGKSFTVKILAHEELFNHETYQEFELFVGTENKAPKITSSPIAEAEINEPYFYQLKASDPDNDPIEYEIIQQPYWLKWNNKQSVFYGTPEKSHYNHNNYVEILAKDNYGATAKQSFSIDLLNSANLPPKFSEDPIVQAYEGMTYSYIFKIKDETPNNLQYSLLEAPGFLQLVYYNELSGIPGKNDINSHSVKIKVTDEFGLSSIQNFTLQVSKAPVKPANIVIQLTLDKGELMVHIEGEVDMNNGFIQVLDKSKKEIFRESNPEWIDNELNLSMDISQWKPGEYVVKYNDTHKSAIESLTID